MTLKWLAKGLSSFDHMPPSFSRICSLGAPQSWGSSAHLAIRNIGSIVCFKNRRWTGDDETSLCTPQRCCRTPTRPRSPTPFRQRLVHPAQTNVILINMSRNVHLFYQRGGISIVPPRKHLIVRWPALLPSKDQIHQLDQTGWVTSVMSCPSPMTQRFTSIGLVSLWIFIVTWSYGFVL